MERPDLTNVSTDVAMYIAYLEGTIDGSFRVIESSKKPAARPAKDSKEDLPPGEEKPKEAEPEVSSGRFFEKMSSKAKVNGTVN